MSNQIFCNKLSIKTFRLFDILVHIAKEDNIIFFRKMHQSRII